MRYFICASVLFFFNVLVQLHNKWFLHVNAFVTQEILNVFFMFSLGSQGYIQCAQRCNIQCGFYLLVNARGAQIEAAWRLTLKDHVHLVSLGVLNSFFFIQ